MKTEKTISGRDIVIGFIGAITFFVVQGIISLFNNSGDIEKITLATILHSLLNNIVTLIFIFVAIISLLKSRKLEKEMSEKLGKEISDIKSDYYNISMRIAQTADTLDKVSQFNNNRSNGLFNQVNELQLNLHNDFKYLILKSRLHDRALDWDFNQEAINSKGYIQVGYTDAERELLRNYKPKFF